MSSLKYFREQLSQPSQKDNYTTPFIFKQGGKYYNRIDYKEELNEREINGRVIISFRNL